jgi:hypothetical protein
VSDLGAILSLATKWDVQHIRALAIAELESRVSPIEALVLARDFDVRPWLIPAYVSVCMRPEPPNLNEAKYLCTLDLVLIATVRENILTGRCAYDSQFLHAYIESLLAQCEVSVSPDSSLLSSSLAAFEFQNSLVPGNSSQSKSAVDASTVTSEHAATSANKPTELSHPPLGSSTPDSEATLASAQLQSERASSADISTEEDILNTLNGKKYHRILNEISKNDFEYITRVAGKWANADDAETQASLFDFVRSFFHRCALEESFVSSASRFLAALVGYTSPKTETSKGNTRNCGHVQDKLIVIAREILSTSSYKQSGSQMQNETLSILLDENEKIDDAKFSQRLLNVVKLIGELTRAKIFDPEQIIAFLPTHRSSINALYYHLTILGPILDSVQSGQKLSDVLDKFEQNIRLTNTSGKYTDENKNHDLATVNVS